MNHNSEKMNTELDMFFSIGDKVVVDKCSACIAMVGKTATVASIVETDSNSSEGLRVVLNFGRGRPQMGRPVSFLANELSQVKE